MVTRDIPTISKDTSLQPILIAELSTSKPPEAHESRGLARLRNMLALRSDISGLLKREETRAAMNLLNETGEALVLGRPYHLQDLHGRGAAAIWRVPVLTKAGLRIYVADRFDDSNSRKVEAYGNFQPRPNGCAKLWQLELSNMLSARMTAERFLDRIVEFLQAK